MAANNSEKIDDLVDPKVLQQLDELNKSLDGTFDQFVKILSKTTDVEKDLSKISTSYKDLIDAISKYEATQRKSNSTQSEQDRILRQQEQLRQRITNAYSEESLELERLRQLMQQITRTRRNLVQEQNSQTGSTAQLRSQLNLLLQSYDAMSRRTRESPIGRQVHLDIQRLTSEITELETSTGRNNRNVGNYMDRIGTAISVFAGNLMTKAVEGLKELASKGVEFVKIGIEMANKAEGITTAFNKLNNPELLNSLRTETKGLISDLTLMQTSVKADTFGIPLSNLGKLLKFAQQRAQETGQSVDYLVNSIIDGIGRKSPLILDNLGISASRLSEQTKKSGDFAAAAINIVNEELEKQGDLALTGADKATQASVKWENAQLAVGQKFQWLGGLYDKISSGIADKILYIVNLTKSQNEQYKEQMDRVVDLEANTVPLIKRYEELKSKAELNKDEQVELNTVMNSLASTVPSAVIEFDKYGNALSINTSKVYEYIKAEKVRLKLMFGEQLPGLEKERNSIQKRMAQLDRLFEIDSKRRQLLDRERVKYKQEYGKLVGDLRDINDQINYINGTTLDNEVNKNVALTNKRKDFNQMNKKDLDTWIKDTKNANSEYKEIAEKIYQQRFGSESDIKKNNKVDKSESERKKRAQEEKKIEQDLAEFRAKQAFESDKKIVEDEKANYEQRISSLDTYTSKQKEAIDLAAENQISNLKKSEMTVKAYEDAVTLITEKAQAERKKIDEEGAKIKINIQKDNYEKLLKEESDLLTKRNQEIGQVEQEGLLKASSAYNQGLINTEQYQQAKIDISRKASMDIYDAEIESLQKSLEIVGITDEQKQDIEQKLGEARIDYQKYVNETIIDDENKAAEKRLEIEKQLAEKRKELISNSLDFISTLFSAQTEKQLSRLDKESEANSKYYEEEEKKVDQLAEAGAITAEQADARKAYLAEQEEKRELALEEKRKEILQRQAKFEKAMAMTRVVIDTSSAIMKQLALTPLPIGAPLVAAIAASGAIQLATILAQPIPEYAEGTKDHKGGLAKVGDGGKHEMVITPDGKIYKTPATDTLMNLPAHTQVLPDFGKAIENMMFRQTIIPIENDKTIIISENKEQIKYAKNTIAVLNKVVSSNNAIRQNQMYSNSLSSAKVGSKG